MGFRPARAHPLDADLDRRLGRRAALRIRIRGDAGLQRGLELLDDAGNGSPDGRPHRGQRSGDGTRVGDAGDLDSEDHLVVVRRPAVGDVRRGQVGGDPRARPDRQHLGDRVALGEHVGVGDLHALGRTGGARRVDEGEHVGGLDGAPGALEVEGGITKLLELGERERAVGGAVDA